MKFLFICALLVSCCKAPEVAKVAKPKKPVALVARFKAGECLGPHYYEFFFNEEKVAKVLAVGKRNYALAGIRSKDRSVYKFEANIAELDSYLSQNGKGYHHVLLKSCPKKLKNVKL